MTRPEINAPHSSAWMIQVWMSFALAVAVTSLGIYLLPVDPWIRAFLGMGLLFSVGSTFSLAKTVRDMFESERLTKRVDEARMNKLITEHDPLKPAF